MNAPPVFLSEADAREIIEEELGRHGIAFENNDVENSGIMIEEKRRRYYSIGHVTEGFDQEKRKKLYEESCKRNEVCLDCDLNGR